MGSILSPYSIKKAIKIVNAIMVVLCTCLIFLLGCSAPGGGEKKGGGDKVATPSISPAAGDIEQDTGLITITCSTADADIYYTTNGSTPGEASTEYTAPIAADDLNGGKEGAATIKAIAVKTDMPDSDVASKTYNIVDKLGPHPVIALKQIGGSISTRPHRIGLTKQKMANKSLLNGGVNGPFDITITFNENVSGFVVGDLTVGNGSAGNFAGGPAIYTAKITPEVDDKDVTVDIAAGVCQDTASTPNANTASNNFLIFYDKDAPQGVMASTAPELTRVSPIPITITFNVNVTGFTVDDLTVENGTAGNFAGSGKNYTATITPSGQGQVTVDIEDGACISATTGVCNIASAQLSRVYDSIGPTALLSSTSSFPNTSDNPIPVTITFSEDVTGFAIGDITVSPTATKGDFAGGPKVYTVKITPTNPDVVVTVNVALGVAQDAAGNGNSAATQLTRFYSTFPTLNITTSEEDDPTNTSPIPVTITFSENVTGFTVGDLTVGNGSVGNFAGGPKVYTAEITPSGQGTVFVSVAAGVCQDETGMSNLASNVLQRTYDSIAPDVTLSTTAPNPNNQNPVSVSVNFTEDVEGFALEDITVGNGTASNLSGGAGSYTVDIAPAGDGLVTINVAAGKAQDAAGNNNTAATQLSWTYDSTMAGCTVATTAPDKTNTSPIPVTITFTEDVAGFDDTDITVTGVSSSIDNFTAVNAAEYTADITPSGQGTVSVSVAAGACQDMSGMPNVASNVLDRTYDSISPDVDDLSTTASNPNNLSPVSVSINFTEDVIGFALEDITVGNGSAGDLNGGAGSYTVNISPTADGLVTVNISAGKCTDDAGNNNTAATQLSWTYDGTKPNCTVETTASDPTNLSLIPFTFTFTESVTGFSEGEITVVNGSTNNFLGSGTDYSVNITPDGDGLVSVSVAAGVGQDSAGNDNNASNTESLTSDRNKPDCTVATTASDPTNLSTIPFTFTFTESVTGFTEGEITVVNGSKSNFLGSGTDYSVNITPNDDGLVSVSVAAGMCQDSVGNDNNASNTESLTSDRSKPDCTVETTASDPTNLSLIPFTFTFTESVTGFSAGGITVVNGSKSNFSGSGTGYSVDITPVGDGLVSVSVAAGVGQDSAGNDNNASNTESLTSDRSKPDCTVATTASDPTNLSTIPFTFTFTESVTGFTEGEITVVNGSKSNFSDSGSNYSVDITPDGDGLVSVRVAAGVCQDSVGNDNNASNTESLISDRTSPSVTITSATSATTGANPIPITITFLEPVTGFDENALTLSNCTSSAVSGGPSVYTANITPTAPGLLTVDIAGGSCQDAAGNGNTAAAQFSRTYAIITLNTAGSSMNSAGVGPFNLAYTVTNNPNRILIVGVCADRGGAITISGVTYNGVAMTLVPNSTVTRTQGGITQVGALYYMYNPPAGFSYNIVASFNGNPSGMKLGAFSLYNVLQSGMPNAMTNNVAGPATTITTNIDTTISYSWIVDLYGGDQNSFGSYTPGADQTTRWSRSGNGQSGASSTKPTTTAGSNSMSWTVASQTNGIIHSCVEIKPLY